MVKLKNLNDVNKIIYEKSFKNLLKLCNILSQKLLYKGLLRLEVLLKESVNLMNLSSKCKKIIIEIKKVSDIIIANFLKELPYLRRFKKLLKKALLSLHEIMNIIGIDKGLISGKAI